MSFKNSPLFHFIVGTLWFITAAITAYEAQTFLGSAPIIFGIAGIGYYARSIYLFIKNRQHD